MHSVCVCSVCLCVCVVLLTFTPTGEGMKIGALALLRDRRRVCVRTSQDCWRFGLKQHSVLKEEVLTVFVTRKSFPLVVTTLRSFTTERSEGTSSVGFEEITPPWSVLFVALRNMLGKGFCMYCTQCII